MPSIEYNDITINVDDEGYLLNREEWDEKVACGLTQTIEDVDECDLTDERIEILKFMRDYYSRFESFPIVRHVFVTSARTFIRRRSASTSNSSIRLRLGRLPDFPNQPQMQSPGLGMSWTERTSVINSFISFSLKNESQILTSFESKSSAISLSTKLWGRYQQI
jgi:TusE/DsrC/DsvC family sulfur relay protein